MSEIVRTEKARMEKESKIANIFVGAPAAEATGSFEMGVQSHTRKSRSNGRKCLHTCMSV